MQEVWPPYWIDHPADSFGYYALGYFNAAKKLAKPLLRHNFAHRDAYPVIFLYRMALELYIKNTIHKCEKISGKDIDLCNTHEFEELLKRFNPAFKILFPENPEILNQINDVCRFFEEKDPKSFTYRYPTDRKGKQSIPANKSPIVLHDLSKKMNIVLEHLDTIDFGLSNFYS